MKLFEHVDFEQAIILATEHFKSLGYVNWTFI